MFDEFGMKFKKGREEEDQKKKKKQCYGTNLESSRYAQRVFSEKRRAELREVQEESANGGDSFEMMTSKIICHSNLWASVSPLQKD